MKIDIHKYCKPLALLIIVLAVGCNRLEEDIFLPNEKGQEGDPVTVGLILGVTPELDEHGREIPLTRAPNDITNAEEEAIRNVWVFQFSEPVIPDNDDSRLLVWSCYIDEKTIQTANAGTGIIPVNLIESGTNKNMLVFIANVNNGGYDWDMKVAKNTYGDLKSRNYLLKANTEDSILYGDDLRNMIMSGETEAKITEGLLIDSDTDDPAHNPGILLTRSLAKIRLELTLGNADYKVLSVKIHDLPDRIWFTDALNPRTVLEPVTPSLISFPLVQNLADGLVGYQETESFVWYIPRNVRGISPDVQSVKDRNSYAPREATYIEIMAKHNTTNEGVVYRIYPGADINDFNIIPNHRYLIKQTITGNGGENLTDTRIEQFGDIRFDGNNNSFILNPPLSEGMAARTYEIPITRVNQYWAPDAQSYPGYGGLNEGIIGVNVRWRVDLLWQDDEGIVREVNDEPSRIWISKAEGKGPDDYFSITVPSGARHGNFVMALRRYNPDSSPIESLQILVDQTLWSWHFWVTNYNPDRAKNIAIQGNKFTYTVPGGQVERYGGTLWGYDTNGSEYTNNWNNYQYNEVSTKPYAKSFMMDRNLGAINTEPLSETSRGSLFYQFGRKDPLPAKISLYDINGVAISNTPANGFQAQKWNSTNANGSATDVAVKVSESVYNPMKIYAIKNNWATNVDGYNGFSESSAYAWHDPMVPTELSSQKTIYQGKSIYDPCPPGWKIPVVNAWEDFRTNQIYGSTINSYNHGRGDNFVSSGKGTRYWPNVDIDGKKPVEGNIIYRFAGSRAPGAGYYGASYWANVNGYFWTAIPHYINNAHNFQISTSDAGRKNSTRGTAKSVRCISMNE